MDLKLTGKLALISGSTKGIGFASAELLAAEGCRVILNGRTDAAVEEAVGRIRASVPKADVQGYAGDLATAAGAATLVQRVPVVDILIKTSASSSASRSTRPPMRTGNASST